MKPICDRTQVLEGSYNHAIRYGLRVYQDEGTRRSVVMISELHDNPGDSVIAAIAQIATQVLVEFRLRPERVTWIEHRAVDRNKRIAYYVVTFTGQPVIPLEAQYSNAAPALGEPHWTRCTRAQVEEMVGSSFA